MTKAPTPLEQILALLPKLDVAGLQSVQARAKALSQFGGAKPSDGLPSQDIDAPDNDADLILSEIAGHLRDRGVEYASVQMLRRVSNYKSFAEKVPPTMIYFRKVTKNRVKLRALIRVAIDLLYLDLGKIGLSVTTRTMMSHWHRVPAVIESNFPGYARRGHLGLLLRGPAEYVNDADLDRKGRSRDG